MLNGSDGLTGFGNWLKPGLASSRRGIYRDLNDADGLQCHVSQYVTKRKAYPVVVATRFAKKMSGFPGPFASGMTPVI